jgi:hypothetical protein
MDATNGYDFLARTFYLGRVELTPEETESRNQEDVFTDNLGVLIIKLITQDPIVAQIVSSRSIAGNPFPTLSMTTHTPPKIISLC